MAEKRRHRRYGKRLKVRFGKEEFSFTGVTSDISITGLFVQTQKVPDLGARLHVELTTQDGKLLYSEGVVMRQAHVPPELRQVVKGGFGMRYLTGSELMSELVPQLQDAARVTIEYASAADFKAAYENELKRGGLFVWTPTPHTVNNILTVEIVLEFAQRRLAFDARVVHVMNEPTRHGIALMFLDAAGAVAAFSSVVKS
jgi:Tfp pilus assembly protein PilZ